jgi:hypothetical protein
MSDDLPQLWKPVEVPGGFKKGKDARRNAGGQDAKLRRVRKALAKFDATAIDTLGAMFNSGVPDLVVEALKFWGKYRLPVPTDKTPIDVNVKGVGAGIKPELAARLAALEVQ